MRTAVVVGVVGVEGCFETANAGRARASAGLGGRVAYVGEAVVGGGTGVAVACASPLGLTLDTARDGVRVVGVVLGQGALGRDGCCELRCSDNRTASLAVSGVA